MLATGSGSVSVGAASGGAEAEPEPEAEAEGEPEAEPEPEAEAEGSGAPLGVATFGSFLLQAATPTRHTRPQVRYIRGPYRKSFPQVGTRLKRASYRGRDSRARVGATSCGSTCGRCRPHGPRRRCCRRA